MLKSFKFCAALLLLASTVINAPALAAAKQIENFDAHSWHRFQKDLPRPAAVVFSTTDCSHCPAIIAALGEQLKNRKPQVPLVVVVMDGEDQPGLLQEPHYSPASRLFVFKGQSAALQYSINPSWRGITPYVALLPKNGETKLVLGKPSAAELESWLSSGQKH
ncbi:hypothetical protein [Undibacterium parvum]|uniref:Thioredoxin domain-containing protein n=1 Tax=Undibacterium parvum TaxID=401471 RepID=A0A3S9HK92_9BURK|nr:hypothetical protein [Undibacterium parvum]AZP12524.1 hypothetical protein EJN92_11215 [Undibacterium parvum]